MLGALPQRRFGFLRPARARGPNPIVQQQVERLRRAGLKSPRPSPRIRRHVQHAVLDPPVRRRHASVAVAEVQPVVEPQPAHLCSPKRSDPSAPSSNGVPSSASNHVPRKAGRTRASASGALTATADAESAAAAGGGLAPSHSRTRARNLAVRHTTSNESRRTTAAAAATGSGCRQRSLKPTSTYTSCGRSVSSCSGRRSRTSRDVNPGQPRLATTTPARPRACSSRPSCAG